MADDGSSGLCGQCQHPFDPHLLITTGVTPADGGIMICQVVGCSCLSTWAPATVVPSATALEQLRELDGWRGEEGAFDAPRAIDRLRERVTQPA